MLVSPRPPQELGLAAGQGHGGWYPVPRGIFNSITICPAAEGADFVQGSLT